MKNLSKLGKALSKVEQKEVFGGRKIGPFIPSQCYNNSDCCNYEHNASFGYVCSMPSGIGGVGQCVPGIFDPNNHPCGL